MVKDIVETVLWSVLLICTGILLCFLAGIFVSIFILLWTTGQPFWWTGHPEKHLTIYHQFRPLSSIGQSNGLLSRRLQVRVL